MNSISIGPTILLYQLDQNKFDSYLAGECEKPNTALLKYTRDQQAMVKHICIQVQEKTGFSVPEQ